MMNILSFMKLSLKETETHAKGDQSENNSTEKKSALHSVMPENNHDISMRKQCRQTIK